MKISLGTDHAGFNLKEKVKALLGELGHEVKDFGTFSAEPPVDYPLFVRRVLTEVGAGVAPVAGLRDASRALRIVEAAYLSASDHGRPIQLSASP